VFAGVIVVYNEFVAQSLHHASHDAIGLLLAIRVNNAHRRLMSQRRVPALDAYIDNLNMLLWPKFKMACENHVKSLENVRDSFEPNPEAPHFAVRRYADFVVALTTLAHVPTSTDGDEVNVTSQVDSFLDQLRQVIYECVSSKFCASLKSSPRAQTVYLVRSYDHICSVLTRLTNLKDEFDKDADGFIHTSTELASLHFFETKLAEALESFVNLTMLENFPSISNLWAVLRASSEPVPIDVVHTHLREFERSWRKALIETHAVCVGCFASRDWRANDLFTRCLDALTTSYFKLLEGEDSIIRARLGDEAFETLAPILVTRPTFTLEGNKLTASTKSSDDR
jgi:hypothetical protein